MATPQNQFGPQAGVGQYGQPLPGQMPQGAPPQQPGPMLSHPTIPYGLPNGDGSGQQAPPQQYQPQMQQPGPGRLVQPLPLTQPQGQPQGQQYQLGLPQPGPTIDPNAIIDGPNVPQELRGRRWGQVMQIYTALADDWMRRNQHNMSGGSMATQPPRQYQPNLPQPQGQPQGQPQQPGPGYPQNGQPQGQPQGQRQNGQPQGQAPDWRDEIRGIVQEVVAPVAANTQRNDIQAARDVARNGIPDFVELEGDIMQMLASAPPQTLTNPQVWESAADLVRGKRNRVGPAPQQYGQQPIYQQPMALQPQYGQPSPNSAVPQYPQYGVRPAVPAPAAPLPQYTFFTEGPTPPVVSGPMGMISPQERAYAQKMGMSDQEYIAWRGGVVR